MSEYTVDWQFFLSLFQYEFQSGLSATEDEADVVRKDLIREMKKKTKSKIACEFHTLRCFYVVL